MFTFCLISPLVARQGEGNSESCEAWGGNIRSQGADIDMITLEHKDEMCVSSPVIWHLLWCTFDWSVSSSWEFQTQTRSSRNLLQMWSSTLSTLLGNSSFLWYGYYTLHIRVFKKQMKRHDIKLLFIFHPFILSTRNLSNLRSDRNEWRVPACEYCHSWSVTRGYHLSSGWCGSTGSGDTGVRRRTCDGGAWHRSQHGNNVTQGGHAECHTTSHDGSRPIDRTQKQEFRLPTRTMVIFFLVCSTLFFRSKYRGIS